MLDNIKNFFEKNFISEPSDSTGETITNNPQLALAALMIEVAEADFEDEPTERDAILHIVKTSFDLKDKDAEALIKLARAEHAKSTDYFQFTRLINDHYSAQQKTDLIENLWRIAFADENLDKYEEHVIRRISDLIYVSHNDFMATKHRAQSN